MQSSPLVDHANTASKKGSSNAKFFLIGFMIFSFILAFVIGGYILGKEKTKKQQASTEISEQIKIAPVELPNSPDSWTSYTLGAVGMELKLPEKLTKLGEWKEKETPSDTGSMLCFSNKNSNSICGGNVLIVGGSSTDFTQGREGLFIDLQGYTKENGNYYANFVSGKKIELKNVKFKEFENENGVEILKILGESETDQGVEFPVSGTPGKGYLGAIVNTKNSKYPGLSVQLKLDEDISEFEFDQILKSFKFTN